MPIRLNLEEIPEVPGVYILKNKTQILYIGKAKNLRNRIKTHLQNAPNFIKKAESFEYIITHTESEALLLEANLIKRYSPRYNIRLTDDKKYPYIAITKNEKYPRIFLTRNLKLKNAFFFGPFMSASAIRKSLKILREIFPVRNCKYKLPSKREIKPCIEYHMNLCQAPCIKDFVNPTEYQKNVENIRKVLSGQIDFVIKYLSTAMKEASEKLNFEYAALLRDRITILHDLKHHFYISSLRKGSADIIGSFSEKNRTYFYIMFYRDGKVIGTAHYKTENPKYTDEEEVMEAFLIQFYSSLSTIPEKIIIDATIKDKEKIEKTLKTKIVSWESSFKKLLQIAKKNAEEVALSEEKRRNREHPTLLEIKELFKLNRIPKRIECVDASQLFGSFKVASLVVFENGKPKKREYRRYKIKRTDSKDDFNMIYEVTYRRFKRALSENTPLPDLYVLDGGFMQLKAALKAKGELGIKNTIFIAFAKRFDDFYLENGERIMLPPRSFSLRMFKRLRDEAHRFAITYHRKIRNKESFKDYLDYIPDIGEKRKTALLNYFGSIKNLRQATIEELKQVPGIGEKLAKKLYNLFHED